MYIKDEFWVIKNFIIFFNIIAALIFIAGFLFTIIIIEDNHNLSNSQIILGFIPVLLGTILAFFSLFIAQFTKLFLKIEENTRNKKESSSEETKEPSYTEMYAVYNNKTQYKLENVDYIICPNCNTKNYVDVMLTMHCTHCKTPLRDGERVVKIFG